MKASSRRGAAQVPNDSWIREEIKSSVLFPLKLRVASIWGNRTKHVRLIETLSKLAQTIAKHQCEREICHYCSPEPHLRGREETTGPNKVFPIQH